LFNLRILDLPSSVTKITTTKLREAELMEAEPSRRKNNPLRGAILWKRSAASRLRSLRSPLARP
jgi:hypothetical protein